MKILIVVNLILETYVLKCTMNVDYQINVSFNFVWQMLKVAC